LSFGARFGGDVMRAKLARWLRDVFATDLRTLALFRVALGGVLLGTLLQRFGDVAAFLSDDGVLPRDAVAGAANAWGWSLHFVDGSATAQALLLGLHCVCALALIFGSRTRLAALLCWVLLASLDARNPLILSGADQLLVCLLFWSLFLPLGARYSVDAALATTAPPADHRHVSVAGAALLVQVLSVYFFSALLKSDAAWWPDGTAVGLALELDRFTTPAGHWLRDNASWAMRPLTFYVYFVELLGPVLALSPWGTQRLRHVVLLLLAAMHVGFIVFLSVGPFPFVSLASLTVLVGSRFWQARAQAIEKKGRLPPKIFYDRDCAFCLKTCRLMREFLVLPDAEIAPAQDRVRTEKLMQANFSWVVIDAGDVAHLKWSAFVALLRASPVFAWLGGLFSARWLVPAGDAAYDFVGRHRNRFGRAFAALSPGRAVRFMPGRASQAAAGLALALVLLWNLASVGALPIAVAQALSPTLYRLRLDQMWSMFAPYPSLDDGWFVIPGELEDGSAVDVRKPGEPLSYAKPASVLADIRNARWQSYEARLYLKHYRDFRVHYARYLCRDWNRSAPAGRRLESLDIVYLLERTRRDGSTEPPEQVVLWRHECRAPPAAPDDAGRRD
jgi:predicted DCC family thiol-disulfide oxidoreductase YuxK